MPVNIGQFSHGSEKKENAENIIDGASDQQGSFKENGRRKIHILKTRKRQLEFLGNIMAKDGLEYFTRVILRATEIGEGSETLT